MNQTIYITNCPDCGEPSEVDTNTVLTTSPPQYHVFCKNSLCDKQGFFIYTVQARIKEVEVPVIEEKKSKVRIDIIYEHFGQQALNMRPDEVMINKGNYAVIRRLPENIDSILEKNEVLEKIMKLYTRGRDEYEGSERHTLDIFKDDVFDILEEYLGGEQ